MKEATGELNMTVIIVLAVAALAAFFYTILWPLMRDNFNSNSKCAHAICECDDSCQNGSMAKCTYINKKGETSNIECPWKG